MAPKCRCSIVILIVIIAVTPCDRFPLPLSNHEALFPTSVTKAIHELVQLGKSGYSKKPTE